MEIELLLAGWLLLCCLSTNLPCNSHALKQGKVREGIHVLVFYTCTYIGRICRVPRHTVGSWQLASLHVHGACFASQRPFLPSWTHPSTHHHHVSRLAKRAYMASLAIAGVFGPCQHMLSYPSRRIAEGCKAYSPEAPSHELLRLASNMICDTKS